VVRLVANVVEKDLRRVTQGMPADVSVDAFPGEKFEGRIAHVAPVLDPATRTAQVEVEIQNSNFRLKPGMYAKVDFVVEQKQNTLVVPANAIVDLNGKKGVFLPDEGDVAKFKPITIGMSQSDIVEVVDGLPEGARVVTTGAAALREGDKIVLLGQNGGRGGRGSRGGGGRGPSSGAPAAGAQGQQSTPGGPVGFGGQNGPGSGEKGGQSAPGASGGDSRGRRGGGPSAGM